MSNSNYVPLDHMQIKRKSRQTALPQLLKHTLTTGGPALHIGLDSLWQVVTVCMISISELQIDDGMDIHQPSFWQDQQVCSRSTASRSHSIGCFGVLSACYAGCVYLLLRYLPTYFALRSACRGENWIVKLVQECIVHLTLESMDYGASCWPWIVDCGSVWWASKWMNIILEQAQSCPPLRGKYLDFDHSCHSLVCKQLIW